MHFMFNRYTEATETTLINPFDLYCVSPHQGSLSNNIAVRYYNYHISFYHFQCLKHFSF